MNNESKSFLATQPFLFDSFMHSCMHETMKTITLDDVAYQRLKAWKKGTSESFSSVVKRVIPEPGSLGALLSFVENRGTCRREGNDLLERTVETRSAAKAEPWT